MGVEHALVHDETMEAYELGKGLWFDVVPESFDALKKSIDEQMKAWRVDDAYRREICDEIWTFIETHPGCTSTNDTYDVLWTTDPDDEDADVFGKVYRRVGTRYR